MRNGGYGSSRLLAAEIFRFLLVLTVTIKKGRPDFNRALFFHTCFIWNGTLDRTRPVLGIPPLDLGRPIGRPHFFTSDLSKETLALELV